MKMYSIKGVTQFFFPFKNLAYPANVLQISKSNSSWNSYLFNIVIKYNTGIRITAIGSLKKNRYGSGNTYIRLVYDPFTPKISFIISKKLRLS